MKSNIYTQRRWMCPTKVTSDVWRAVLWVKRVYSVVHSFNRENCSCRYWWCYYMLLMAACRFARLQVSCEPPPSKHNSTGQATFVQVRLCKKEVAASSRLEICCLLVLWPVLCICSMFAFLFPCSALSKPFPSPVFLY